MINRIVPLAPNLAIRIRPDLTVDRKRADFSFEHFGYRIRHVSRKEVIEINRLIVQCAEDNIFYRDDLAWVRNFIAKNRQYRLEQITSKIPADNGTYLLTTHKIVPFPRSSTASF